MLTTKFPKDRKSAAYLLLQVSQIANDEVYPMKEPQSPTGRMISFGNLPSATIDEDSDISTTDEEYPYRSSIPTTPTTKSRTRAVSICSHDLDEARLSPFSLRETFLLEESSTSTTSLTYRKEKSPKARLTSAPLPYNPSNKVVGDKISGPIRAILRKKFSWKSFPELENYLVENRQEYLGYSSSLNYTAEQKRYNNTLTQGLLDLAASEGYVFDGFTFAAVRDRIRCYYKSYVQAVKKKKRKKRG